ncbi:MAG: hypothetical protein K2Y08_07085 [Alphaproteobacteria bacterium]|nr:hypothetical protein [Alphaproteobacteria bacterium]
MLKKISSKKVIFGGIGTFIFVLFLLFFDAFYGRNFRSMETKIDPTQEVDLRGLQNIRASGGSPTCFISLKWKLRHIDEPIIIVDAMSEYHGFIKSIPTALLGYHKPAKIKHLMRRFLLTGSIDVHPELVVSEAEEAKKYGFDYEKVNIGSTFVSSDEAIDNVLTFYDNIPENAWLHFHCSHGKGRTSLMLVMLDTMKNAPQVSVKDIVKRQHLLGSEDLFNTEVWENGTYTKEQLENRKEFVEKFYQFICQRKAGGQQRWSDWHQTQYKSVQ